jgi:hypothetical protein
LSSVYNEILTLTRLLLVFPAYLLGMILARAWESCIVISCYHYTFALNDVRNAGLQLSDIEKHYGPEALDQPVVEQWLANTLPADDPAWRLLVERQDLDPWGNPYRCVQDLRHQDGTHITIGVYSTGRDGVSQTHGNDPDDLNSWDEHTGAYDRAEIAESDRKQSVIQGLYVAPFVYIGLLAFGSILKRSIFRRPIRGGAFGSSHAA